MMGIDREVLACFMGLQRPVPQVLVFPNGSFGSVQVQIEQKLEKERATTT